MFQKIETEKYLWQWRWPIAVVAVLLLLLAIQILRVNRPRRAVTEIQPVTYSTPGPLISDDIVIPARDFYVREFKLNRRTALSGSFQTGNIKARVSVLVMDEPNYEKWKLNSDYHAFAETGYVPGGKVAPVLAPGTYFVVIDNRANESSQRPTTEFVLE
jgi:hypothetical protein